VEVEIGEVDVDRPLPRPRDRQGQGHDTGAAPGHLLQTTFLAEVSRTHDPLHLQDMVAVETTPLTPVTRTRLHFRNAWGLWLRHLTLPIHSLEILKRNLRIDQCANPAAVEAMLTWSL